MLSRVEHRLWDSGVTEQKKTIYDIIFQSGIIMMVHIGIGFIQPGFIVATVLEYKIR